MSAGRASCRGRTGAGDARNGVEAEGDSRMVPDNLLVFPHAFTADAEGVRLCEYRASRSKGVCRSLPDSDRDPALVLEGEGLCGLVGPFAM
eukprot:2432769-Rhodomonas_salina.1